MPDVYLHARMAMDVAKSRNEPFDRKSLLLGAQYFDPLYYAFVSRHRATLRKIADQAHNTDTKTLMEALVLHAKENGDIKSKSFLTGIICHYALDIIVHPYVYHHVGVYNRDDALTDHLRGLHLKFERSMDAALFKHDTGTFPRRIQLLRNYFPLKKVPREIRIIVQKAFEKRFHIQNGDKLFQIGVTHMRFILKYFATDRYGIKRSIYHLIDRIQHKEDFFLEDLSYYRPVQEFDFLNEKHRQWQHPITGEKSTKSVMDLYKEAVTFASELLNQIWVEDRLVNEIFADISLNTGVDCKLGEAFAFLNVYQTETTE
jgi:hypothetical protein